MNAKIENYPLSASVIDDIADAIAQTGFILVRDFLPLELAEELLAQAQTLSKTVFKAASIGRDNAKQLDTQIRTDSTLWLSEQDQAGYIHFMQQLERGLNRRLFMGLTEFECHFSHYKKGDFYQRHMDAFKTQTSAIQNNRRLSSVFYLNPNWQSTDGGELWLYEDLQQVEPLLKVSPLFNQCVIFLSDTFPHEVKLSNCDRYSIAGWFR